MPVIFVAGPQNTCNHTIVLLDRFLGTALGMDDSKDVDIADRLWWLEGGGNKVKT